MQKIYRVVCGLLLAVIRREPRQVMKPFIPNVLHRNWRSVTDTGFKQGGCSLKNKEYYAENDRGTGGIGKRFSNPP